MQETWSGQDTFKAGKEVKKAKRAEEPPVERSIGEITFIKWKTSLRNPEEWLGCLHIAKLGLGTVITADWDVKGPHSKFPPDHSERRMRNIKEPIEWKPGKTERPTSPLAFIKSTRPSCKAQEWKQCSSGHKRTADSAGEKLKTKSPRLPGKRTSTLKCVTASLLGLTRSLLFSSPNVVEYFQCLITCILCGKRKKKISVWQNVPPKLIRAVCIRLKEPMSFSSLLPFMKGGLGPNQKNTEPHHYTWQN